MNCTDSDDGEIALFNERSRLINVDHQDNCNNYEETNEGKKSFKNLNDII